jgi:flavin-binding protein dodecin
VSVAKIIELVGTSDKSWQDAVENAVRRASKTVRNIRGVDILGWTGKVEGAKIVEYRADVKSSFAVEEISG